MAAAGGGERDAQNVNYNHGTTQEGAHFPPLGDRTATAPRCVHSNAHRAQRSGAVIRGRVGSARSGASQ
jgi:hypothetical protein